ncbi:MAG: flagellar hook-basal body complex protein FliE [Firmicutes bacterium]|nr:flagellar hook-basal body complex protein FliE [Bacillota bacterium]
MQEPLLGTVLYPTRETLFGNQNNRGEKEAPGIPFKEIFTRAWQEANALQKEAEQKAMEAALGEAKSFHEVIIATEKAVLALQLLTQIQNKLIDAYHEIMRLQV